MASGKRVLDEAEEALASLVRQTKRRATDLAVADAANDLASDLCVSTTTAVTLADEAGAVALRGHLDSLVASGALPCAGLLILRHGAEGFSHFVGEARPGAPLGRSSIVRILSMTSFVTSFVLRQLADEGKVSLDDTVAKHLPEWGASPSDSAEEAALAALTLSDLLRAAPGGGDDTSDKAAARKEEAWHHSTKLTYRQTEGRYGSVALRPI